MRSRLAVFVAALAIPACSSNNDVDGGDAVADTTPTPDTVDVQVADEAPDAPADVQTPDASGDVATDAPADVPADASPTGPTWCSLGSDVPGITVPDGFCLRRFVNVRSPRTMTFAPNGDLLVGAPTTFAPGGSNGGPGAVMLYSDDNKDGSAEEHTFLASARGMSRIPDVHGVAIGGGHVYLTTTSTILRVPYTAGLRAGDPAMVEDLNMPANFAAGRWTHGLAYSVGGTLYTSGGMVGQSCGGVSTGGIYRAAMGGVLAPQSDGYRNPMYLRCHPTEEVCAGTELGEDQTPGAREKIVRIRPDQHYGYPCCRTRNMPASGTTDCSMITAEEASFTIADTPFGFDWERGSWPAPYRNGMFVAMHGSFYTSPPWLGAGVRFWPTDATTHMPMGDCVTSGGEITGGPCQAFVRGVGFGRAIQRPSDVSFSPDGRMFFSDDIGNAIYWVAPTTLRVPSGSGM